MLTAAFICSAAFSLAQVSVGVRAGAPLGVDGLKPYTAGPTVEVGIPILPIRVVADALYKRLDSGSAVWDVPIMVRLEAKNLLASPFVGAGPSFRWYPGLTLDSQRGFAVGAGVRIRALFLKITPEIRYTRYGDTNVPGAGGGAAEFLLGLTF